MEQGRGGVRVPWVSLAALVLACAAILYLLSVAPVRGVSAEPIYLGLIILSLAVVGAPIMRFALNHAGRARASVRMLETERRAGLSLVERGEILSAWLKADLADVEFDEALIMPGGLEPVVVPASPGTVARWREAGTVTSRIGSGE